MSNNRPLAKSSSIKIADSKDYPINGTGEACVSSYSNEIKFQKVLYVPGVNRNLLFVGKITNLKLGVYFDSSHCYVLKPPDLNKLGSILGVEVRYYRNGLYKVSSQSQELHVISHDNSSELWHERLGHLHIQSIMHMSRLKESLQIRLILFLICVPPAHLATRAVSLVPRLPPIALA